jgi:hypothetical protein
VEQRSFPAAEHSVEMDPGEWEQLMKEVQS